MNSQSDKIGNKKALVPSLNLEYVHDTMYKNIHIQSPKNIAIKDASSPIFADDH